MGLDGAQHEYEQHAVVANFLGEHSHLDTARQWFGDDGVLALLPLPLDEQRRGRLSLVWSVPRARADELMALTPEGLAATVSNAVHGQFGRLEPLSSAQCLPLMRLSARALVAPRVALVGDAGHVIHPMAGQGMNLGLGDVTTLARVLAQREAGRDCGEITLLRRYARARAEPVLTMTLATDGLYRMFYQAPVQIAPLRNLAFRALNQLTFAKRWMVTQAAGSIF
jgi:ubiquinone biosynthesis UbiH/UbiF/VisC/COQ6 family hydroxylase